MKFLRQITNEVLFVEWVDPSDEAVQYFQHLDFNKHTISETYCYENFLSELKQNFAYVSKIGKTRTTRRIFKAIV